MSLREKVLGCLVVLLLIATTALLVQINVYHASSVQDRNGKTELLCDIDQKVTRPGQSVSVPCRRVK